MGVVLTACEAQNPHWERDSNLHLQDCCEDTGKTQEGAWVALGWGLWCLVLGSGSFGSMIGKNFCLGPTAQFETDDLSPRQEK